MQDQYVQHITNAIGKAEKERDRLGQEVVAMIERGDEATADLLVRELDFNSWEHVHDAHSVSLAKVEFVIKFTKEHLDKKATELQESNAIKKQCLEHSVSCDESVTLRRQFESAQRAHAAAIEYKAVVVNRIDKMVRDKSTFKTLENPDELKDSKTITAFLHHVTGVHGLEIAKTDIKEFIPKE